MSLKAGFAKYQKPLVFLFVAVFAFLVYLPWINDTFLSDDWRLLARNANLSIEDGLRYFCSLQEGRWYRPLYELSIAWSWSVSQLNPAGYHAFGFVLHAINSLIVAVIGTEIAKDGRAGLLAGVLFGVIAAHPDAVLWIAGRNELIACFFALCSFYAHMQFRKHGGKWWLGTIVFYIMALMAKETALPLPALLISYDLLIFAPSIKNGLAAYRNKKILGPVLLINVIGLVYLLIRLQTGIGYNVNVNPLLLPKNFVYYLLMEMAALPVSTTLLTRFPLINFTVIGMLSVAGLLVLWLAKSRLFRERPLWFALSWMLIALPPVLPIVSERSVYISTVGCALTWAVCLIAAFNSVHNKQKIVAMLAVVLVVGGNLLSLEHRAYWWHQTSVMLEETMMQLRQTIVQLPEDEDYEIWLFNLPGQYGYAHAFANTFPFAAELLFAEGSSSGSIFAYLDDEQSLQDPEDIITFFQTEQAFVENRVVFLWEYGELVELEITPARPN